MINQEQKNGINDLTKKYELNEMVVLLFLYD